MKKKKESYEYQMSSRNLPKKDSASSKQQKLGMKRKNPIEKVDLSRSDKVTESSKKKTKRELKSDKKAKNHSSKDASSALKIGQAGQSSSNKSKQNKDSKKTPSPI